MYYKAGTLQLWLAIGRVLLAFFTTLALACSTRLPAAEHEEFFPIIALRGGASTTFVLHNPGTRQITVKIELHSPDGGCLERAEVHLGKGSSHKIDFSGRQGRKTPGWAKLSSLDEFTARGLVYDGIAPWIGFHPSKPATRFKLFASVNAKDRLTTGVALANPSNLESSAVTAVLYDKDGREVRRTHFTLGPLRHQSS